MKSSPVVNFINVKCANFTYESLFGSFLYLHGTREKLPKRCLYIKSARKTLMKSTPGVILGRIHFFLIHFRPNANLTE